MARTSKTTILDLNPNCLRKIGSFLELKDIIDVAIAFHLTGANISLLKNRTRNGNLDHNRMLLLQFAGSIQELFLMKNGTTFESDEFNSEDIASVLTHFGSLFSHLYVNYEDMEPETRESVDDAILSNCIDCLESINLIDVNESTLQNICKPFSNITKVHIDTNQFGSHFSEKLSRFNRWFPQMNELRLTCLEFETLECLEQHFPNLKSFGIEASPDWFNQEINNSNLKIMFHLNPQLQRLELNDSAGGRDGFGICLSPNFVSFIARKLPNLRDLSLAITFFDYEPSHEQNTIDFKSLSSLKISVWEWSYLSKFSIKTKQPLALTLELNSECFKSQPIYETAAKFTEKMKNIKSLTIHSEHEDYELFAKYVVDFVSGLRHLESFRFGYDWRKERAADAIIYFITNCEQIKELTCLQRAYISKREFKWAKQAFIASFNGTDSQKFDASKWDVDFDELQNMVISKRS